MNMLLIFGVVLVLLYIFVKTEFLVLVNLVVSRLKEIIEMKYLISKKTYNLADYFEDTVRKYPSKEALVYENRKYTYSQLNKEANKVANWAISKGIKKGDVIALYMTNRPQFIICWMGLFKVGATIALINTSIKRDSLTHAFKISKAKFLIIGSELFNKERLCKNTKVFEKVFVHSEDSKNQWETKDPELKKFENLNQQVEAASSVQPKQSIREGINLFSRALLIYTSGTTGLPKAAVMKHKRCINIWISTKNFVGVRHNDRMYVTLPLYHTSGNLIGTAPFSVGGTVILKKKFSASKCVDDLHKYKATCFLYIGEILRYLMMQKPREEDATNPVRMCVGNGLRKDIWMKFKKRFTIDVINELYSSTEGNITTLNCGKEFACGYWPRLAIFTPLKKQFLVKFDVNSETHIRDKKTGFYIECEPNEVGELLGKIDIGKGSIKGNFDGYHGNPEATKKKILRNVFTKGDKYFRSGDLIKIDEAGYYYFVDRIGDTFRWKGQNVATSTVSSLLTKYKQVEEVNVYGVKVPHHDGRAGMASIVLRNGEKNLDLEDLSKYVKDNLTVYASPLFLRIQTTIQKTSTFKYRKVDLVKDGFNPNTLKDSLYFLNGKKGYVKLDKKIYGDIEKGSIRI